MSECLLFRILELVSCLYPLFSSISQRREAVVQRRQRVKSLEHQRTNELQASLAWQQFSRDADEVPS